MLSKRIRYRTIVAAVISAVLVAAALTATDGIGLRLAAQEDHTSFHKTGGHSDITQRTAETGALNTLAFSTFLGGSLTDGDIWHGSFSRSPDIAVDSLGNIYVTSRTSSPDFPVTAGGFDTTHSGPNEIFVTKLDPTGSSLIYSTYLGSGTANGIAVDAQGNAYVTGSTSDPNFPVTVGAYDESHNGSLDVFVAKLNPSGSALVYSTFIGGTAADVARAIDLDSGENVYITGVTWNTAGYPTTEGAFDQSYNGLEDAFVTKLNSSGTGLIYSTYLGGNAQDVGNDIEVDSGGNAYIVGMAVASPGHAQPFPTTEGSFDVVDDGGQQGFLTKLTPAGDQLVYSTFLSANGTIANAVAVDGNGNTFVTGTCGFFPTTEGAYDETQNGFADTFVAKLENDGSDLVFSTYVGGGGTDWGMSIEIDPVGQAYVSGSVKDAISLDFPTTPGGFDTSQGGAQDAFFLIISNDGAELAYSTFLGGVQNEESNAIALTAEGDPVVAGITSSAGFPVSVGAFDQTFGGGTWDVFVTKFGTPISPSATSPFDFDGDGATDVSVFRPNSQPTAQWWLLRSSDSGTRGLAFGSSTDVPVAADFTGDGRTDVAFWRPSSGEWFILRSEDDSFFAFPFGSAGDIPAPGDFDGDGKADPAVYRPSSGTWFIVRSSDGGLSVVPFGVAADQPIVADYDGDGKDDVGVYRAPDNQFWLLRSTDGVKAFQFGAPGDRTTVGDWTGDGKADVAFFRPSTSEWYVIRSEDDSFFAFPWGATGDVPSPGDFDGDGKFDPAVWRPSDRTWYIFGTTNGFEAVQFGSPGDVPLPSSVSVN